MSFNIKNIDKVNDNAFKEEKEEFTYMTDEERFKQDWEKYKKHYIITVNPDELRTSISVRMKPSYHKMFARYAAKNDMTIGDLYEKAAILYMKTHAHPDIDTGDVLDQL